MSIILIYAVITFISLLGMIFLILTSPKGWEDENGFHFGKQDYSEADGTKETATKKVIL